MDQWEEFLREFFDKYSSVYTQKQKEEFFDEQIRELPNYYGVKGNHDLYNDSILFITGFGALETGQRFEFNESMFNRKLYFNVGKGLETYLAAQRTYNTGWAKESEKRMREAISELTYFQWFPHYKLGKIYFLLGNLDFKNKDKYYRKAEGKFNLDGLTDKVQACNAMGDLYLKYRKWAKLKREKQDFEEAAEAKYIQAGDYFHATNGLGNLYRKKKDYAKAIFQYKKALKIDSEFFFARYYLGDCYRLLGDYTQAEHEYQGALKLSQHPYAFYGLGRTYYEVGNRRYDISEKFAFYQKSLQYLDQAIASSPNFPRAFREKARVLEKLKDYNGAKTFYTQAAAKFHTLGNKYHEGIARSCARDMENLIELKDRCNTSCSPDDISEMILCATIKNVNSIEEQVFDLKESFHSAFLAPQYTNRNQDGQSTLDILKRWNSYTPLITDNSLGGGYFLKMNGIGIVIDPGFNFIYNYKKCKHTFDEINIVMGTHSHDDHTADLEAIISLLYRFNRHLKEDTIPREIAKERNISSSQAKKDCKKDIQKRYEYRKKTLVFYVSSGVFKKFEGYFTSDPQCDIGGVRTSGEKGGYIVHVLKPYETKDIQIDESGRTIRGGIVKTIPTYHPDKLSETPPLGFVFIAPNWSLVYTSDGGWTNCHKMLKDIKNPETINTKEVYKDNIKEWISTASNVNNIYLLSHIGGFDKSERLHLSGKAQCVYYLKDRDGCKYPYSKNPMDENSVKACPFYDYHLGRLGLVQVAQEINPRVCIISEWGEEFRNLRTNISNVFSEAFKIKGLKTVFLPADIGLRLDFNTGKIRSITDINFDTCQIIYENLEPEDVIAGEVKLNNTLFYYQGSPDQNKDLHSKCMEALIQGFSETDNVSLKRLEVDGNQVHPSLMNNITYYTSEPKETPVKLTVETADESSEVYINFEKCKEIELANNQEVIITVVNNLSSQKYVLKI